MNKKFLIAMIAFSSFFCLQSSFAIGFKDIAQHCNGRTVKQGAQDCTMTLNLNQCKNKIVLFWPMMRLAGSQFWTKKSRNWCTVTFDTEQMREERIISPKQCDEMVRLFSAALQGFPAVAWQDAQCTHFGSEDGFLYIQFGQKLFEPVAARIPDLDQCTLYSSSQNNKKGLANKKRHLFRCTVINSRPLLWLKKVSAILGVDLEMRNQER